MQLADSVGSRVGGKLIHGRLVGRNERRIRDDGGWGAPRAPRKGDVPAATPLKHRAVAQELCWSVLAGDESNRQVDMCGTGDLEAAGEDAEARGDAGPGGAEGEPLDARHRQRLVDGGRE